MEIIRAEKMGFCIGVKVAVDTCYKYVERVKQGFNVYLLGMIVHNEHVVRKLEEIGFKMITEEDIILERVILTEEDVVIVRAHGTKKEVYEKLVEKKVKLEDAACIFVKNIRKKIIERENKNNDIIFIGDKNHPEVEGIISFGKNIHIFKDLEELKKFNIDEKKQYSLLTQTTLNKEKIKEIKNHLENSHLNVNIFNKICGATQERQVAVEELAKKTDIILIVGGKKSSNTKKLYEISSVINENTKLLSSEDELVMSWFKGVKKIGITAGASTPEEIIKKIENKIRGHLNV
ncbi:MAG: 4-hydroxy-3-methylbut-2-enyl diphosphate reductase [Fusobacteriaceae bacterium]